MNPPTRRSAFQEAATGILASPRFAQAMTLVIVGIAYLSFAVRSTIGWPGYLAIVVCLVVVCAFTLVAARERLEWRGILPISLLVFIGWTVFSLVWSDYQWTTLGAVAYQLAFALLGATVALLRDPIQIVRAFGDVLRLVLGSSLVIELISGVLLDTRVAFLDVTGSLGSGGPIQGLLGSRNQLGLVAVVALITFVVEWRARSVRIPVALVSIAGASLVLLLSRSPVSIGAAVVIAAAGVVLLGLRRAATTTRRAWQFVLLVSTAIGLIVAFVGRGRLIELLNAGSEFEVRYRLWQSVLRFVPLNELEGFGWIGIWRRSLPPYVGIDVTGPPYTSALNAYLDVLLQLGLVGLFSFIALLGLALVRSWLLASNKRSVVYIWPALVLVLLALVSAAESSILVEFGWLTLVICALIASQHLSWRHRLPE